MTENTSQPAAEFKADFNDLNYFKNIYHQEYIRTAHQSGKKYRSLNGAVQRAVVEKAMLRTEAYKFSRYGQGELNELTPEKRKERTEFIFQKYCTFYAYSDESRKYRRGLQDILTEEQTFLRAARDDRKASHPAELMNPDQTGNQCVVVNLAVTGGSSEPNVDHVVPDLAVVGDMGRIHEHVVIADPGGGVRLGAGVDRAPFPEDVVAADLQIGDGAGFDRVVLGRLAERSERGNHIALAERGVSVDVAVADQPAAGADPDIRPDVAEGADFNAVVDHRAFGDDTGGMDFRHIQKNLSVSCDLVHWFILLNIQSFSGSGNLRNLQKHGKDVKFIENDIPPRQSDGRGGHDTKTWKKSV